MKFISIIIICILLLNSCGIYRTTDAREISPNADERGKKNIEEGKGFRLMGWKNKGSGNVLFDSSNQLGRGS